MTEIKIGEYYKALPFKDKDFCDYNVIKAVHAGQKAQIVRTYEMLGNVYLRFEGGNGFVWDADALEPWIDEPTEQLIEPPAEQVDAGTNLLERLKAVDAEAAENLAEIATKTADKTLEQIAEITAKVKGTYPNETLQSPGVTGEQAEALRNFDKPENVNVTDWDFYGPTNDLYEVGCNLKGFVFVLGFFPSESDAQRTALLWNKCAGLTNEELEALPPVKELSKGLSELNVELKKSWYAHEQALRDITALKKGNLLLVTQLEDATHRHAKQCERLNVVRDTRNGLEAELKRLKSRNLWQRIFNL
jgi:hypothetical protein